MIIVGLVGSWACLAFLEHYILEYTFVVASPLLTSTCGGSAFQLQPMGSSFLTFGLVMGLYSSCCSWPCELPPVGVGSSLVKEPRVLSGVLGFLGSATVFLTHVSD